MSTLLVIIPDRLSDLIQKGEIQPRYFNPGNIFNDVHLIMTNDDAPEVELVTAMVGDARLTLYNFPEDYRPLVEPNPIKRWLLFDDWATPVLELVHSIEPDLVRCHGTDFNVVLARYIKRILGIPYVVSLHTNPDQSPCRRMISVDDDQIVINQAMEDLERKCLADADVVMPVYQSILPYLERLGVFNARVCYNVLDGDALRKKIDFDLSAPAQLISVGRQYNEKNANNIFRAIADLPDTHLTMVGDGPLHEPLKAMAAELGISERVKFIPSLPNNELCSLLPEFDIFVTHTDAWELNKSVLEALLSGLPVILNRRIGFPVPELTPSICCLVENTPDSYWRALRELLDNHSKRESLGKRAAETAWQNWSPAITEKHYADIYTNCLKKRQSEIENNTKSARTQVVKLLSIMTVAGAILSFLTFASPFVGLGEGTSFFFYEHFGWPRKSFFKLSLALTGSSLIAAIITKHRCHFPIWSQRIWRRAILKWFSLMRHLSPYASVPLLLKREFMGIAGKFSMLKDPLLILVIISITIAASMGVDKLYGAFSATLSKGSLDSPTLIAYRPDGEYSRLHRMEMYAYDRNTYQSFTVWGYREYQSEFVNITDGLRKTVQPTHYPEKPTRIIWFFGGSTMLGQGSNDANTIPSHSCRALARYWPEFNWRCLNFGIGGYVSTQEFVQFLLEFRNRPEERPDTVVFYDGVNDFIAALHGFPGEHHEFSLIREKMGRRIDLPPEDREGPASNTPDAELFRRLIARFFSSLAKEYFPNILTALKKAESTVERNAPASLKSDNAKKIVSRIRAAAHIYNRNRELCPKLLEDSSIQLIHAFQPSIFSVPRNVPEEEAVLQKPFVGFKYAYLMDSFWKTFHETVANQEFSQEGGCRSVDLSTVFADENRPVFFDWMHTYPLGNQYIGYALAKAVAKDLNFPTDYHDRALDAPTLKDGDVNLTKALK